MPASEVGTSWTIVRHDQEAVLAALHRGECDGILPAASEFMDGFAGFLDEQGVLGLLDEFPDHRQRRSIAAAFFCTTLLHKALFRIDSLSRVGSVLFQSPDVLRKLGFNVRQINDGFYVNGSQRPFNVEALADHCAAVTPRELLAHQLRVSRHLLQQHPELLTEGVAMIDSITVSVAPGHYGRAGMQFKVCVLALWHDGQLYPMLWHFTKRGKGEDSDLTQAKRLVKYARWVWGKQAIKRLVVDRGFIDGSWLSSLAAEGVHLVIGLKSDMLIYQDMVGLSRLPDTVWRPTHPPKLNGQPQPTRTVCAMEELHTWEACTIPLHGCVLRDQYPDGQVKYQGIVTSDPALVGDQVHKALRERWQIEEAFMALTRYWHLEHFGSCRPNVAAAQVHFTLMAYCLLNLYQTTLPPADQSPTRPLILPTQELTVYWRNHFAILRPSQLLTIIFDNIQAWQHNKQAILQALRFTEGDPRPRGPD